MARKNSSGGPTPGKPAAEREAAMERLAALLAGRVCTLGELFGEAGIPLDKATAGALARTQAVLARNVGKLTRAELETVHASPAGGAEDALGSDAVLVGVLRRLGRSGKARAHGLARLSEAVGTRYKPAFRAALAARIEQRRWPEGVGAVQGPRGPLVFLLEDVASGARAAPAPAGFARAFDEAFEQLRRERGLNLVELSALRAALRGYPREAFDRELYELRRANRFVLHTFDGRHGKLKPEELAAAIDEGGRRFVYAARREHD